MQLRRNLSDVTATLRNSSDATSVTSKSFLDFDVIKARVAKILEIDVTEASDIVLGEFFGHARETINRLRSGAMKPSLPAALAMAQKLGMSVEEITAAQQPKPASPPPPRPTRPASPATPKPPQGPKAGE